MNNQTLAIKLAKAESEDEVVSILTQFGVWDDISLWLPFGGNENNYSTIGNQQQSADAAFVEKIINSIDACLIKECRKRKMNPSDATQVPQNMSEALQRFFNIKNGQMTKLSSEQRKELATNIVVAASGQKAGQMNLAIADKGEGQTPRKMPDTLLSISKSNKLKIPFVQGKFNMGGTGVLPFCGDKRLQLIISRRCPELPNEDHDPSFALWSVTIVRKETRPGNRSSMYTYLTDRKGDLLTFQAEALQIIPKAFNKKLRSVAYDDMSYGTFIKLFNYQLSGYKTSIILDYYNRVSLLVPNLALPVRFRECRDYEAKTNETTLSGLETRLFDDRSNNIEEGFPYFSSFVVDGQTIQCGIYLFKQGQQEKFKKKDGVLFTVNGQTQGIISDAIFARANLSYIAKSVLVLADCTQLDTAHQEDLFMTSRDRLRRSDFSRELERAVEQELKGHQALKKAEHDRRANALKDKLSENKPLKEVLQKILKKSSVLSKLFLEGKEIPVPFNSNAPAGDQVKFVGKLHPTFFSLKGSFKDGKLCKKVPCNQGFRVQFTTDAQNDYFGRQVDPGKLILRLNGQIRNDLLHHLGLYDGLATLTITLPADAAVGNRYSFETSIEDECILNTFPSEFEVVVCPAVEPKPGPPGRRHKPIDSSREGKQKQPSGFLMPELIEVHEPQWAERDMDRFSALVYQASDEKDDYYLNMDNTYLLMELKGRHSDNSHDELTKARFKYSMALIGMSVVSHYKNMASKDENIDVSEQVKQISSMIAPVLIPMLDSMSELTIEDVVSQNTPSNEQA